MAHYKWRRNINLHIMDPKENLAPYLCWEEQSLHRMDQMEEEYSFGEDSSSLCEQKEQMQDKTMHLPFADQTEQFMQYYVKHSLYHHAEPNSSSEHHFTHNQPLHTADPLRNGNNGLHAYQEGEQTPMLMGSQGEAGEWRQGDVAEEWRQGDEAGGWRQGRMGLKSLTMSVYGLVSKMGSPTYKEVATQLLKGFRAGMRESPFERKEENNIRRRTYDALNVLVAAQLLSKNKKHVQCQVPYSCIKTDTRRTKQLIEIMQKEIQTVADTLQLKRNQLTFLEEKKQLIKSVFNRNLLEKDKKIPSQVLRFPFFGIVVESTAQILHGKRNNINILKMSQRFDSMHGDLDILLQMQRKDIEIDSIFSCL